MRHARARGVIGLAIVAAVATALVAAPVASAKAKPNPSRTSLVKAVNTASGQAAKLIKASRACPSAARQRTLTNKVRIAQRKGLAKAGPTSLRLRQLRISVHTRRLAVAIARCSGAAGTPGSRDLGSGANGANGSNGANGTNGGSGGNGAQGAQGAPIGLDALGSVLNATGLLDGGVLPGVIPVVDAASLGVDPACIVAGSACVGVDSGALTSALTGAVGQATQQVPVLAGVLDPLLAQVQSTLAATGPDSLLTVERASDSSLVVNAVPGSSLQSLLNLLGVTGNLPSGPIATVQVRT